MKKITPVGDTLLNGKDDIEWLFSTHLKKFPRLKRKTKSFIFSGNEDYPSHIVLMRQSDPEITDSGIALFQPDIDGDYRMTSPRGIKRTRKNPSSSWGVKETNIGGMRITHGVRIIHNRLLGGWFVVRGPHQTPISGRFATKEAAQQSLIDAKNRRDSQPFFRKNPRPRKSYSVGELRRVAQDWHGGQWSPMYAFSSSGTVTSGLYGEAMQNFRRTKNTQEKSKLKALATYALQNEAEEREPYYVKKNPRSILHAKRQSMKVSSYRAFPKQIKGKNYMAAMPSKLLAIRFAQSMANTNRKTYAVEKKNDVWIVRHVPKK